MTIVDEIRKKLSADGKDTKGVNTIVDGLKKLYGANESGGDDTPDESTPGE